MPSLRNCLRVSCNDYTDMAVHRLTGWWCWHCDATADWWEGPWKTLHTYLLLYMLGNAPQYLADHIRLSSSIGPRSGLKVRWHAAYRGSQNSLTYSVIGLQRRWSMRLKQPASASWLRLVAADFQKNYWKLLCLNLLLHLSCSAEVCVLWGAFVAFIFAYVALILSIKPFQF